MILKISDEPKFNDDLEDNHDEGIYEESFKKDIEDTLKRKIISSGTPLQEKKAKKLVLSQADGDFKLEKNDFYEITDRMK